MELSCRNNLEMFVCILSKRGTIVFECNGGMALCLLGSEIGFY